jgi:hypothetical protein
MLVVLLAWPVVAMANEFHNRGAGTVSCGSWTQEHHRGRGETALLQENWVLGFVTAAEVFSEAKRYKSADNAALFAWISNYCSQAPLDDLAKAAISLTLELQK